MENCAEKHWTSLSEPKLSIFAFSSKRRQERDGKPFWVQILQTFFLIRYLLFRYKCNNYKKQFWKKAFCLLAAKIDYLSNDKVLIFTDKESSNSNFEMLC